MAYGCDQYGFEAKPFSPIREDMQQYIRTNFKHDYTIRPDTVDGMILLVFAFLISILWQQLQAVYNAFIPSYAEGINLDNINELRGIYRKGATATRVTVNIYGIAGTIIPDNSVVSHNSTGKKFILPFSVEIPDNGNGFGNVEAEIVCTEVGAIEAQPNTITVIESPVSGWLTVTNEDEGIIGNEIETDAEFRTRASMELALNGRGTYESIRSNLLKLDQVVQNGVFLFENDQITADPAGRPPKSFEVVVQGGDTKAIAQEIFSQKPVGIQAFSTATNSCIPLMTSNTAPYGVASAQTEVPSHEPYKAFDGNLNTFWRSANVTNQYIQFQLDAPQNILVFTVKASDDITTAPKTMLLKGGNNGSSWETIYTTVAQTDWQAGEERSFVTPYYEDEYSYYRVEFLDNNGGTCFEIVELKLLAFKKIVKIEDNQGFIKTVEFSRPQQVPIYVSVDIKKDADVSNDYDTLVKQNLTDFGNGLGIGKDVVSTSLYLSLYQIEGTLSAQNLKVGTSIDPELDQVQISDIEIASFSPSRIVINYV